MSHHPREDSLQKGQIRRNGHYRRNWERLLHIQVGSLADALGFWSRHHFQSLLDIHLVIQYVAVLAAQSKHMDLLANLFSGTVGSEWDGMTSDLYFRDWRQT